MGIDLSEPVKEQLTVITGSKAIQIKEVKLKKKEYLYLKHIELKGIQHKEYIGINTEDILFDSKHYNLIEKDNLIHCTDIFNTLGIINKNKVSILVSSVEHFTRKELMELSQYGKIEERENLDSELRITFCYSYCIDGIPEEHIELMSKYNK